MDRSIISTTNQMFSVENQCLYICFSSNLLLFSSVSSIPFDNASVLRSRIKFSPSTSKSKNCDDSHFAIKPIVTVQSCSFLWPEFYMLDAICNVLCLAQPLCPEYFISINLCAANQLLLCPVIYSYRVVWVFTNWKQVLASWVKFDNSNCSSVEPF